MSKRSQGLPLNMIVIAAIVIIVLIVVVSIFSGKMTFFNKGVRSCVSQGGHCSCWSGTDGNLGSWEKDSCPSHPDPCPENWAPVEGTDCNANNIPGDDYCCIKVL